MGKNPIYKIVSFIIFLGIVLFLFFLYNEIKDNGVIQQNAGLYMGGILFLSFFAFILTFWIISMKPKNVIVYAKKEEENYKQENKLEREDELVISIDVEKSVANLTKDFENAKNIEQLSDQILRNFAQELSIVQGLVFIKDVSDNKFKVTATYAFYSNEDIREFSEGEGISGQVAKNKVMLNIDNIPENYVTALSGLGSSTPNNLLIIPIIHSDETISIIELASFIDFPDNIEEVYKKISEIFSKYIVELKKA